MIPVNLLGSSNISSYFYSPGAAFTGIEESVLYFVLWKNTPQTHIDQCKHGNQQAPSRNLNSSFCTYCPGAALTVAGDRFPILSLIPKRHDTDTPINLNTAINKRLPAEQPGREWRQGARDEDILKRVRL